MTVNGMEAYFKHKQPTKETKEILKKNKLKDYKPNNKIDEDIAKSVLILANIT